MGRQKRLVQVAALCGLALVVWSSGCGGGASSQPAPAIGVSVSPGSSNVAINATQQFTATVSNDATSKGVTWTLTQNGTACSPSCGTIAPTSTASGAPTTFTAPAVVPNPAAVTVTATSAADATKNASSNITVITAPSVSVAPTSATMEAGSTQTFTATVTNDAANGGVNWSVAFHFCKNKFQGGGCYTEPCQSSCGTFTPAQTSSGAATVYTAPGNLSGSAEVLATSVSDPNVGGSAAINFRAVSVSVSPGLSSVALKGTQQLAASVTNDATGSGVTWTLTQNGAACSPTCGTIAPSQTASGVAATFAAPAAGPTIPFVTVTATSVEDNTASGNATLTFTTATGQLACSTGSGSESLLKGQYAFLLHGTDGPGIVTTIGSFAADGTGHITAGEIDDSHSSSEASIGDGTIAAASSYAVGPDHRGCLFLGTTNGAYRYFRFALGSMNSSSVATKGHIIEFDQIGGTQTSGTLRLQDPASFSASELKGTFVFGMQGNGGAIAGSINADGISSVTGGTYDQIYNGGMTSEAAFPATPFTCCSANGRGTITSSTLQNGPQLTLYMINSSEAFITGAVLSNCMSGSCDIALGGAEGEAFAAPGPFSNASLNGTAVWRYAELGGNSADNLDIVHLTTLSADGVANLTANDYENNAGTFATTPSACTYSVSPGGRVTFSGASAPPVILYLYGQNQGILLGTDTSLQSPAFGFLEPQAAGPFTNASFSGAYMLGTEIPTANLQITACNCWDLTFSSGVLNADGAGNASGTSDQVGPNGVAADQSQKFSYTISADGSGNVGSGTTAILISGNKLVFMTNTSANPIITVVEK